MRKEFSMSNDKILINFTAKYCNNFETLLESEGFRRVLESYLRISKDRLSLSWKYLRKGLETEDVCEIRKNIARICKYCTVMSVEEIVEANPNYKNLFEDKDRFISFIEDFYLFWRRLERYTIINSDKVQQGLAAVSFTEANSGFSNLVLKLYRKIEKNVLGYKPKVFRQIPAGGNSSIMINKVLWPMPKGYEALEDIHFIDSILLETPFITYPKKNTRSGMFSEVTENPLRYATLNKDHWFCYPAKVGELLAFIYFHRDFMEHGITLCNLFEMARSDEYRGRKPDLVYVFGAKDDDGELKTVFYNDEKNDIMLGYVNHSEEIDYFGYMKKMTLTLHNLVMIKRGYLPIHGAMVNIELKDGKQANVVIMGDSGAGKSESLEAFRTLSEDYISDMTIIFDDMGTFKNLNGEVYGYGTEIGAFVRLDDLDQGYAFKEMDRSIFMNPDKINARLVMPVAPYKEIIKGYKVDLFLYANNYTKVEEGETSIEYFKTPEDAIKVFKSGARMAKGTTSETGLVESYFANPFGPAQKQKETDKLIEKYFNVMFKEKVKVGQIKTCLAVKGQEKTGPRAAALELFEIIKNL
ncbi:phosphoenolpyruvate carboxykinase [Clostridium septicum]|uniref:Phosphoenolpyruvate carboxykinase n=1 Tax=Clostridium septicum TaxID=1504 RepID=A0A9N7JJX0_CLOSE|nr:phosphoenolpyruvate carboxykinase [Clostridium septicum]AYE33309.1 phosphoenolpyruvate carboxykinase [Clostridium septicum]MDU1314454.1 phosphoenolpyruvate carboxykinase [Clostridium septicum]QAS61479.1 phosphoenolpyruvate carboxykinase [Clostridium septicum]UEC22084.1 phosphoenolpyruvate carboxykinase [Clostridium septicum]USR99884.1 phosphoenolpyruvate carboxykinase [Clostridium septicum]